MNHSDIINLKKLREIYARRHRQYEGCGGITCSNMFDHTPNISYPVSYWDRISLIFTRGRLYERYNLRPDYVYSTQDIITVCGRICTPTPKMRDDLFRDMRLLIYDNECKKWAQLIHAEMCEIDRALGVRSDMTYTEYITALNTAENANIRPDVSGSKSRARNIARCIIYSIDDKIARSMIVVRPFGVDIQKISMHPEYI